MTPGGPKAGPFKVGDRILDRFEVRGVLGRGGHAFVYDCFNAFLAEEVAIKIIPNPPHRGNQLFNRARGEAQMLYRLNHPNVVKVMDGGELDGMAYMVMEKLEGMTLREHLRKCRRMTSVEALSVAVQVADALESAHAMNVIHRDLKPDNIFLLPGNRVKVLDFGIAKFLEGGYQTTQKDMIQGTAPYMSPEQAQGHGVTFASDIFQLGTVLYEMIAGICPCMIGAEEPTLQVVVAMQIAKLPPRLKTVVRGVPEYVDLLVWRAIAKAAQQRYPSMLAFTDAIQNALQRLKAELPPSELLMRVVRAPERRTSGSPKQQTQTDVHEARTTPIALVTSSSMKAAGALLHYADTAVQTRTDTDEFPRFGPPAESIPPGRASQPAFTSHADPRTSNPAPAPQGALYPASTSSRGRLATSQRSISSNVSSTARERSDPRARAARAFGADAARSANGAAQPDRRVVQRTLLRAALVGVVLAIPAGMALGLWRRTHGATASAASAGSTKQLSTAVPPITAPTAAATAATRAPVANVPVDPNPGLAATHAPTASVSVDPNPALVATRAAAATVPVDPSRVAAVRGLGSPNAVVVSASGSTAPVTAAKATRAKPSGAATTGLPASGLGTQASAPARASDRPKPAVSKPVKSIF